MYKLLLVDDEVHTRNALCDYFPWDENGFEIAGQCENGMEALEFIKNNPVDVVLCDIEMPVMSGIDLARKLSSDKSKVKVVFLSAYRDFEYAQKAIIYGVRDYVIKPIRYREIVDVFTRIRNELNNEVIIPLSSSAENNKSLNECNYNEAVIKEVIKYLETNFRDASLEGAAQHVHMSAKYLSMFFRNKTGKHFSDYLASIRMQMAARLLKDIKYRAYEVGEMVGYSNPKNFTRAFKSYYHVSPKEFRSAGRNMEKNIL